ncbi:hypothetical protein Tco_0548930 [Tanacetum coccineum]
MKLFQDMQLIQKLQDDQKRIKKAFEDVSGNMIVMTSMIELESLFSPLFDEYFNGEYQVVSKSFAVTTADASDKRQQQPDLTSSTSTRRIGMRCLTPAELETLTNESA